jgi:hypothetical protein
MKIISLSYNYGFDKNGPFNTTVEVNTDGVKEIKEHEPHGDGDKWYFDIVYDNGDIERIFNPDKVRYSL